MSILAAACAVGSALTSVASGSEPGRDEQATRLQRDVNAELRRVPGGRQIGRNEIAWHGGRVVLTLPPSGTARAAGALCMRRSVCLYSDTGFRGRKVTFKCYDPGPILIMDVARYFPPGTRAGVSSYQRTTSWGKLFGAMREFSMAGSGNVPGWFNDQAGSLATSC